jgi:methylated-DNA-[protein]-cysteine S-methyltransferase
MTTTFHTTLDSPVGELLLVQRDDALTGLYYPNYGPVERGSREPQAFKAVVEQLDRYFAGQLQAFEIPLAPVGTPFQRQVWDALMTIGYGQTVSYRYIAELVGKPAATRAVGAANGRNPISIIVPCHRVIGADGTLTGYGGGLQNKQRLLELEGRRSGNAAQSTLTFP